MPLSSGDRVGHYEILSLVGKGGMGEVYRGRDTKLKREVAIKVLPPALAHDPERMARFQREAEVLASLNHPNIASIYGVEDGALVMELVEGQAPKGPLPFDEAWRICAQIAAALEYAHERGIVHRDLKPANVMVTPEGVVKLLDFGLAKALSNRRETSGVASDDSPTLTIGATEAGVILGTAAYMAPEQAKGKQVDKRADIWAFGVVFYELLTGQRLFKGEDVADTLAQVLMRDPDLRRRPPESPQAPAALPDQGPQGPPARHRRSPALARRTPSHSRGCSATRKNELGLARDGRGRSDRRDRHRLRLVERDSTRRADAGPVECRPRNGDFDWHESRSTCRHFSRWPPRRFRATVQRRQGEARNPLAGILRLQHSGTGGRRLYAHLLA